MGLRKDATYLQFKDAIPDTVLGWDGASHSFHMGVFTPATSTTNGTVGLVPKPLSGQQLFILSNNGWVVPATGTVVSVGSGLNNTGGIIKLGGLLTEDVYIDGPFYYMIGDSTRVSYFRARSTGGFDLNNDGTVSGNSTITNSVGSLKITANSGGTTSTNYSAGIDLKHDVPTVFYRASPNSLNNTIDRVVTFRRGPATVAGIVGLGLSVGMSLRNTAGTYKESDGIKYLFTNATNTAEDTKYTFNLLVTGTDTEIVDLDRYGFVYKADYSPNWTDRSLVDRGYVLAQIALGGAGIINTAAANEIPKSGSSTTIIPSGIYSLSAGTLSLGTGLAGTSRYVSAEGSAADVALKLYAKGNAALELDFGLGGLTVGDPAVGGGRVLTVGSSGGAAGFMFVSKGGDNHKFSSGFASSANIAIDPYNAKITLVRSSTTVAQTFSIEAGDALYATNIDGDNIRIKAGDGYVTSGNGGGGNVVIQAGNKRVGGSGVDGNIVFNALTGSIIITQTPPTGVAANVVLVRDSATGAVKVVTQASIAGATSIATGIIPQSDGASFVASPLSTPTTLSLVFGAATTTGIKTFTVNGSAADETLRIYAKGVGNLELGISSTASPVLIGSTSISGDRILSIGTSATNAAFTIKQKGVGALNLGLDTGPAYLKGSTVTIEQTNLEIGAVWIAGDRLIYAKSATGNSSLYIMPQSGGHIVLGVSTGAVYIGDTSLTGNRFINTGSSSANADLTISQQGIGSLNVGNDTGTLDLRGASIELKGLVGAAATYFHSDGTWKKPITTWVDFNSGITPTGFASLTLAHCRYCDEGNSVRVVVGIEGTAHASAGAFTFILPFAPASFYGSNNIRYTCFVIDGSVNKVGRIVCSASSTTCTVEPSVTGGAWTLSGTKACFIEFTYLK